MTEYERQQYFLKAKRKRITNKEIANALKCSASLISMYWNGDCNMYPKKIETMKRYIDEIERFRYVKEMIN